jgi:gamma-glutamyltranspeptidase/glutathione hydrolase
MNNRMTGFSVDPRSPNVLAPGKRTMHTLNTYLVFKEGELVVAGNTPGGHYQVQTNLQVLTNILDFGLDPQAAIDAARWGDSEGRLLVEDHMPVKTQAELARRGHNVQVVDRTRAPMGRAQVIQRTTDGILIGGSDERGEGAAAGS